jgi:TonB family protein
MCHLLRIATLIVCASALCLAPVRAQDDQVSGRKIVSKVTPEYPPMAHTLHLSGVAKIQAHVATSGKVEAVQVLGGHPLLAQAAANAVSKWRWEPSSHESAEIVEVKFMAQ